MFQDAKVVLAVTATSSYDLEDMILAIVGFKVSSESIFTVSKPLRYVVQVLLRYLMSLFRRLAMQVNELTNHVVRVEVVEDLVPRDFPYVIELCVM